MLDEPFATWLARELATRKLSKRGVAALCGVDHSTISRLLAGNRQPSLDTVRRIVAGLNAGAPMPTLAVNPGNDPSTRISRALHSDPVLTTADVHELMVAYNATRRRRLHSGLDVPKLRKVSSTQKPDGPAEEGELS